MLTINEMPDSSELNGKSMESKFNNMQQFHPRTNEPIDPYLTQDVIDGFIGMFSDNREYIKHLDVLRTFRNYAADIMEKDPSVKEKLFPLFDTTNRIAGILLRNPSIIDVLPKRGFFIYNSQPW